jgi:hypothetical protein
MLGPALKLERMCKPVLTTATFNRVERMKRSPGIGLVSLWRHFVISSALGLKQTRACLAE